MGFELPDELFNTEWKRHKANLATDTGIGKKLTSLTQPANRFDINDPSTVKALTDQLKVVEKAAMDAAGDLSPVIAGTKKYLIKMSGKAKAAVKEIEDEFDKNEAEKKQKMEDDKKARNDLKEAANKLDADKYWKIVKD